MAGLGARPVVKAPAAGADPCPVPRRGPAIRCSSVPAKPSHGDNATDWCGYRPSTPLPGHLDAFGAALEPITPSQRHAEGFQALRTAVWADTMTPRDRPRRADVLGWPPVSST